MKQTERQLSEREREMGEAALSTLVNQFSNPKDLKELEEVLDELDGLIAGAKELPRRDQLQGVKETPAPKALDLEAGEVSASACDEEILPEKNCQARATRPRRAKPLLGPTRTRQVLSQCSASREETIVDLLARVLNQVRMAKSSGADLKKQHRIWWDGQLDLEPLDSGGAMAVAKGLPDMRTDEGEATGSFNLTINTAHPAVARWLARLENEPEGLYFIALAALDAVRAMTSSSELSDQELTFHTKLLGVLEKEIAAP